MANIADLDAYKENQEEKVIDTSKKVKIGFIGTGWIAEAHARALLKMEDVEIVALADLVPGKAQKFAEKFGLKRVVLARETSIDLIRDIKNNSNIQK